MRAISPQQFHQPGHDRTPGSDPTPRKRRSTPKGTVQQIPAVAGDSTHIIPFVPTAPVVEAKPRKGKGCGSGRPRYTLTRALIKKALAEGIFELQQDRQEQRAAEHAASVPAVQESGEVLSFVACYIDEKGQEQLRYITPGGKQTEIKEVVTKPLEDILAEKKVRILLTKMKKFKLTINVGALVQAAKLDPKLYKMLQETKVPLEKSEPTKSKEKKKSGMFSTNYQQQAPKKGKPAEGAEKKSGPVAGSRKKLH